MVAGSKRRKIEDVQPINLEDVSLKLLDLSERDACLVALLYLSGRRITEILGLKKKDFKIENKRISFETFNEKVYRQKPSGQYQVLMKGRYYEKIRPHWRMDVTYGKTLSVFITKRLGSLADNDYLFQHEQGRDAKHIKRGMAYKIVRFYFPDTWLHLFRHERFTEIAKVYRTDPVATHRYTFHKRFESTLQYIRAQEEEKI